MEEFFGNEINIDVSKVQIAYINDIITTDNNKPIIATRDIKTCIAVLIICENEAHMTHLVTEKDCRKNGLEKIKEILKKVNSPIKAKMVFCGKKTPPKYKAEWFITQEEKEKINLEEKDELADFLIDWNKYPSYLENDNGSIAYNFSTNQYYGIDGDGIFYEYRLGAKNKKPDPALIDWDNRHTK